jgi:outer membrane protein TolC
MVFPLVLSVFSARSEEAPGLSSGTLGLKTVLNNVLRDNPELKAARMGYEAVKTRAVVEATPDKPRLDVERMYAPRGRDILSGAEEKSVSVSQEIPFPTVLYYRSRAARRDAEGAFARVQAKERDLLAQAKAAYAMVYLSRHAIHVFEENVDLMRGFSRAAEAKYAAGKAPQSDALKAQVELSKMLNMLVTLQQERETNRAMLNTLMNRPPESPLGEPEDPPLRDIGRSLEALTALALRSSPALVSAGAQVDGSRDRVRAARSEYLPDIMVQYRERNMVMGTDSRDLNFGFTVPLWFWKQAVLARSARAERDMARAEYQSLSNMTRYEVKNWLVKVQTARRLVDLYRTSVLPQAEQALTVTRAAYQSDRMGFLDLLDAARSLLDFRLEHYGHIAEYVTALAELERAVGSDLEEVEP